MKTKIVTIHNWDGSKYKVKAPVKAKYLGILARQGDIRFYKKKPPVSERFGNVCFYAPGIDHILTIDGACPKENRPCEDDLYGELLLEIEEV